MTTMPSLNEYIRGHCGIDPANMSDVEIDAFFTQENFLAMFGPNDSRLPDGLTFETLRRHARGMRK